MGIVVYQYPSIPIDAPTVCSVPDGTSLHQEAAADGTGYAFEAYGVRCSELSSGPIGHTGKEAVAVGTNVRESAIFQSFLGSGFISPWKKPDDPKENDYYGD
jgi:hypothetical protein